MVSEDQSIRMLQGDSVNELLYTIDKFIKLRETMTRFEDDMLHDEFKKVLEHDHRETFIQLMADNNSQEKISCSLVLKLKVFISKYLQEHYTRCITRAALFFKNVPGTFFNATHQVKAIAIAVSEVNPQV